MHLFDREWKKRVILWLLMRPIIIYNYSVMLSQISRGIQKGALRHAKVTKVRLPPPYTTHTLFFHVLEERCRWIKQMLEQQN